MTKGLIYDIGVHDGSDTAYYLSKGYDVVGVEASPVMAAALRDRFSAELRDGRLRLLNVGVAEQEGEAEFWICDDEPVWSSFDRTVASRGGARHHAVRVPTRPFADILEEHGVPYYCKIDIEGHDRMCIETIRSTGRLPQFVSIEMAHEDADKDIAILTDSGYDRFKILSQTVRAQPLPLLTAARLMVPSPVGAVMRHGEKRLRGVRTDDGWSFPSNSSGPFGHDTPGRWRGREETVALWRRLRSLDARFSARGLGDWYDIHATR